jgi:succinate dehydrogenase/fumarate reductase flavoprotein subunit
MAALGRGDSPYPIRTSLKGLMWEKVGLRRNEEDLKTGLDALETLGEQAAGARAEGGQSFNVAWQNVLDVRNQITVATLIAHSAIERDESRGSHFRDDIPDQKDDGLYNVFIMMREGKTVVERSPVRFTRVRPGKEVAPSVSLTEDFVD